MRVFVRIKALGKRKDVLTPTPYALPDSVDSLRQLLSVIVASEVDRYTQKKTDVQLIPYLTTEQIESQADAGKVSFGRIYSDRQPDKTLAIRNAIQCWEDGIIRVFMDETELTALDDEIKITDGTVFTFIRLTFLAGRMW